MYNRFVSLRKNKISYWPNQVLFQKSAVKKMSTNEDKVSLLFEMLIPDKSME